MNPELVLCLVLLGTFGLINLLLSSLVALAWRAGLIRIATTSADLLTVRLLPVAGGVLIVLTVVLPAFLRYEPQQEREAIGPWLVMLAAYALASLAHGIWRGWRACSSARTLLKNCGPARRLVVDNGREVRVVDVAEPIVAAVGAWRPRIVAAESVASACSPEEFRQVIAHEAAHISTRDNLKLLLLIVAPDALAWTPLDAALTDSWRAAAEREADRRATGDDPHRRVALASALVKVARLLNASDRVRCALNIAVALDDVPERVCELLEPPPHPLPPRVVHALAACAFLVPVVAPPLYTLVHQLVELLVSLGL